MSCWCGISEPLTNSPYATRYTTQTQEIPHTTEETDPSSTHELSLDISRDSKMKFKRRASTRDAPVDKGNAEKKPDDAPEKEVEETKDSVVSCLLLQPGHPEPH